MPQIFVLPRQTALDDDANPLARAQLYFFQTGTNNPQAVFTDALLTTPHSHPVEADSAGRWPKIYLNPQAAANYRMRLATFDGVQLDQQDDIDRFTVSQIEMATALNAQTSAESGANITPSNYIEKAGYLQRYGGVGNGSTVSTSALTSAAAQAVQASGVPVRISGGSFRIDANTTLVAGVTLDFTEGGSLTIDSGRTLTINGKIVAHPGQQIFSGSGSVVIAKDVNPSVWANWFSGGDIGAKINAAVNAVSNVGPLTIRVSPGTYAYSTQIDLVDSESIRVTGSDTCLSTPNNRNPNLAWSGGASSGSAIDASGAFGFELDHLSITYTNAAYDGDLIKLGIGSSLEARLCYIHDNSIQGTDTATDATRLIDMVGTLSTAIERNYFRYAERGVVGQTQGCNGIAIRDNWFEKDFTIAQIQGRGGSWDVSCNVFEGSDPGGPVTAFELTGELNGLSFRANMCVDGAVGTGTLINLSSAVCTSTTIENNVMGGGATAVLLRSNNGESDGIAIRNNYIIATTGVDLAGSKNCSIVNNRFQCTTPWTGTNPTRYFVNGNDMNGAATSGVVVADTDSIVIAGTSLEGSGLIFVYSVEDNAQAIYALNGSANTATEISDPASLFTNSSGSASSINIYASGGNSYRLENRRGNARTVIVNSFFGR